MTMQSLRAPKHTTQTLPMFQRLKRVKQPYLPPSSCRSCWTVRWRSDEQRKTCRRFHHRQWEFSEGAPSSLSSVTQQQVTDLSTESSKFTPLLRKHRLWARHTFYSPLTKQHHTYMFCVFKLHHIQICPASNPERGQAYTSKLTVQQCCQSRCFNTVSWQEVAAGHKYESDT